MDQQGITDHPSVGILDREEAYVGHEDIVTSAAFSPDGTRIVTASRDRTARLWSADTGEEIAVLRGHEGQVTSAAFLPDGTRIVTAYWDNTVRLWEAATGEELGRVVLDAGLVELDVSRTRMALRDSLRRIHVFDYAEQSEEPA